MGKLAKKVAQKVRDMYMCDKDYKKIVELPYRCEGKEENGDIKLVCISFSWRGTLEVTNNYIIYMPENGINKVLMKYSSFEELLKIDKM